MDQTSVVLIGMRGAGKTTCGKVASKVYNWDFIDLDEILEKRESASCAEIVEKEGWKGFREKEEAVLKDVMEHNPNGTVIACGGGIVESLGAREYLSKKKETQPVVYIQRDINCIVSYLEGTASSKEEGEGADRRPNYAGGASIKEVFKRRKPWFEAVSSHDFNLGSVLDMKKIEELCFRYFYSLKNAVTPNIITANASIACWTEEKNSFHGYDGILLHADPIVDGNADSFNHTISKIRQRSSLPLIVNAADNIKTVQCAIRNCCEYVIVTNFDEQTLRDIEKYFLKTSYSGIILERHSQKSNWGSDLVALFNLAKSMKRIRGLILRVTCETFAEGAQLFTMVKEISSIRMPEHVGAISVQSQGGSGDTLCNVLSVSLGPSYFFDVSAKGHLCRELSIDQKLHYCLFGKPIKSSPSPTLHNTGFEECNMLREYTLCETDQVSKVESVILSHRFMGASVTIPLKEAVIPLMTELTGSAKAIGAVNTIIRKGEKEYCGDNTDWLGIFNLLKKALPEKSGSGRSALVVGAGGTSFAACYCINKLGMKLYIHNRTHSKAASVASRFDGEAIKDLRALPPVDVVVSTVPATAKFELPEDAFANTPVVLDAAYRPRNTALLLQAKKHKCATFAGIEMLIEQGLEQFQRWTGREAPRNIIEDEVYAFYSDTET